MTAYHALEWLIVAAAVGGSGWAVVKRLRPKPRDAAPGGGGCSSCDSCSGCGSATAQKKKDEQPVRWQR